MRGPGDKPDYPPAFLKPLFFYSSVDNGGILSSGVVAFFAPSAHLPVRLIASRLLTEDQELHEPQRVQVVDYICS